MACNPESPADGAAPAAAPSSPPHATTPGESLMSVAKAVSVMGGIIDAEIEKPEYYRPTVCCDKMDMSGEAAEASSVVESSDLLAVVKSKGFSSSHEVGIVASAEKASGERSGEEETRIRPPVMLLPSKPVDLDLQVAVAPPQERSVNRCLACRKRLGLRGFKCRCGDLFCASHRYSDEHDCSFDYKAAGRLAIAKENPLVISGKVIKL